MATDGIGDAALRVFRADQRAIGESVVTERSTGERSRSDSMGYADFVQRFEADPAFARWFSSLDSDIHALMDGVPPGARLALTQRALVDLIDFVDPDWIRFPDAHERGKLPPPTGMSTGNGGDHVRRRRGSDSRATPSDFRSWAEEHGLYASQNPKEARAVLPRRPGRPGHQVVLVKSPPWVELHAVAEGRQINDDHYVVNRRGSVALSSKEVDALNGLLRRFDRPTLPRTNRHLPLA